MRTSDPVAKNSNVIALSRRAQIAELVAKYVTILLALAGATASVWNYFEKAEKELQLRQKEFRLAFFNRGLELYLETCRVVGTIASAEDPNLPEIKRAIDRFYALYWGDLCVVEDPEVESQMIEFEKALRHWQVEVGHGLASENMRHISYALAHACRSSLDRTFVLGLRQLPPKPADAIQSK